MGEEVCWSQFTACLLHIWEGFADHWLTLYFSPQAMAFSLMDLLS